MIRKHEKYRSDGELIILEFAIRRINDTNLLSHLYQPAWTIATCHFPNNLLFILLFYI